MRGLMISRHVQFSEAGALKIGSGNADRLAQDWRAVALLWDKLLNPTVSGIHIADTAESAFLKAAGVLREAPVGDGSIAIADNGRSSIKDDFLTFYREMDVSDPGVWTIARGDSELAMVMDVDGAEGRGLLLRLVGAIPIPTEDVPLEDVLDFKGKRSSELLGLHAALGEVYQHVLAAPDNPLAEMDAISGLQEAASRQLRVSRESPLRFRLADIQLRYDIPSAVAGIMMAAPFTSISTVTFGALLGVRLSLGPTLGLRDRKSASSPFDYVASYHRELFT